MNSAAVLVFLALMLALSSGSACPQGCERASSRYRKQHFKLDSDLRLSSVAPWDLRKSTKAGREPEEIEEAVCSKCIIETMTASPIYLQILVYQRISNSSSSYWCTCPFKLAVGCTCVAPQ